MSFNPYAPPEASLSDTTTGGSRCWQVAPGVLYVMQSSELPARCVKCNEPAERPVKLRTLYWHAPGWYLLILFNLLIYAIAALAVRKKVRLSPGLCAHHASRRRWFIAGSLAAFVLLFGGGLVMLVRNSDLGFIMIAIGLVAMIGLALGARTIYPVHIDERGARFKGCGEAFLRSLDGNRPY